MAEENQEENADSEEETEEQDSPDETSEDTPEEEESSSEVEEVSTEMQEEESDEDTPQPDPIVKDDGKFYGTGRRKESVARVWVESGDGEIIVNDGNLESYFMGRPMWIQSVKSPLQSIEFEDSLDVWATVEGGGLTGQADSLQLGIARAIVDMDENARKTLRLNGHLTRDDRQVERKKVNQPGARKKQQVSKR